MEKSKTTKKKAVCLSISDKIKIINMLKDGVKYQRIMDDFGISKSTVFFIKSSEGKLKTSEAFKKRQRKPKILELDSKVWNWYKNQRNAGVPIRGIEIKAAAKRFAEKLHLSEFKGSDGWLRSFRCRHNLLNKRIVGEALSADTSAVAPFKAKLLSKILENQYLPEQIYNGDETGIVWKAFPNNTQAGRSETVVGHKVNF